jgi:hypothetical protein
MKHFLRNHKASKLTSLRHPFQPLLPIINVEEAESTRRDECWASFLLRELWPDVEPYGEASWLGHTK